MQFLTDYLPILLFAGAFLALLSGYPVAFALSGSAIIFAAIGSVLGVFDFVLFTSTLGRILNLMVNETLVAVPLFVFMGIMLERSRIAEELLVIMGQLFGARSGGLGISVVIVGALLAASTGIVGATVVTMGLISLPTMMKAKYDPSLASGLICASGTLAQLLPPSTVLILLGITLQNANTQANLNLGRFSYKSVGVTDLFAASLIPGLMLVGLYILWILYKAASSPQSCPPVEQFDDEESSFARRILVSFLPPILLIVTVLGSILSGLATATESAAIGAVGAIILALLKRRISGAILYEVSTSTLQLTTLIFTILIGATIFSLVFRGLGGEEQITSLVNSIPGGALSATIFVLALMFLLGFLVDTFEIIFIVVPIFAPILIAMDVDPVWLGVAMAIVLQTSYLTPPFGFAIFYLQGVAPELKVRTIYRGVLPFTCLQLLMILIIWVWPSLVNWLPDLLFQ